MYVLFSMDNYMVVVSNYMYSDHAKNVCILLVCFCNKIPSNNQLFH